MSRSPEALATGVGGRLGHPALAVRRVEGSVRRLPLPRRRRTATRPATPSTQALREHGARGRGARPGPLPRPARRGPAADRRRRQGRGDGPAARAAPAGRGDRARATTSATPTRSRSCAPRARRAPSTASRSPSTDRTGCRMPSATTPTCTSPRRTRRRACWPSIARHVARPAEIAAHPASIGRCADPDAEARPTARSSRCPSSGASSRPCSSPASPRRCSASRSSCSPWPSTTRPPLAGIVTFASIFPGLLIAPIAGRPPGPPRPGPPHGVRLRRRVRQPRPHRRPVAGRHAAGRAAGPHRHRHLADEHPQHRRPAHDHPADGAVVPVGAGQRHRCERLRRRDDPGPADRRQPRRVPRRPRGDDRDRHPVRPGGRGAHRAPGAARRPRHQRPPAARLAGRDCATRGATGRSAGSGSR